MKLLSKPKEPYLKKIGTVKIEAKELVHIMKEHKFTSSSEIIIKNENYQFDSIQDAEKNYELLSGNPTFIIKMPKNSFQLRFNEGVVLKLEKTDNEEDVIILDKIANNLKSFRTPFYFLSGNFLTSLFVILLLLSLIQLYFFKSVSDIYEKNQLYVIIKRGMFFLLVPGIYISYILKSPQVVLKDKRNILNDVHDKSIISLILFIGGIFLFWSATNLGSRP